MIAIFCGTAHSAPAAERVSFEREVMAVMSKSGCNLGACHGNQNGKGGFKLSLRGQDPQADFVMLTRDLLGRRANSLNPESSLILQKPLMVVAHEGGLRFRRDSLEFRLIRDWLADGLRADPPQSARMTGLRVTPVVRVLHAPHSDTPIQAIAEFSDGSKRDVTRLSVFEPSTPSVTVSLEGIARREGFGEATVVVRYLGFQQPVRLAWLAPGGDYHWQGPEPVNQVDVAVFQKLRLLQINPSDMCDDTTFLRRVTLDLTGAIPTSDQARHFTEDSNSNKRQVLIEQLLESKSYADWWALKWSDMLRSEEKTLDRKGVQNFHAWIRESIAQDKPLNRFVRELIASRGSSYAQPAANYYRALREPLARSEATAQLFLGIRLQCAKCHNHPFDKWTQDDYYSWGNLFARVDYKILENNRRDNNDSHEFDGEQIIFIRADGDLDDPRTKQPRAPRFLGNAVAVASNVDRLEALANWLTTDNRQFAKVMVNRVWSHLMGRGIVEPVDDFRATNPPVNPELLEALTDEFMQHGYSLKQLIRTIANSKTYQLSAVPNETNRTDESNFARSQVRRLTAEQLLDAMAGVTGARLSFNGYPSDLTAKELPGVLTARARDRTRSLGDRFLKVFGKPQRLQSCECERVAESTLSQAFQLVSGELMNEMLSNRDNRLTEMLEATPRRTDQELILDLYWSALSRPPTADEQDATKRLLESAPDRRQALEDITWGILNSDEFLLRR